MSASLYEILELSNGDVVLQRVDEPGEPLVAIRFSAESLAYLGDARFEVAKAMIEAGMDAAQELAEQGPANELEMDDPDTDELNITAESGKWLLH
jgi:hypothetical protein